MNGSPFMVAVHCKFVYIIVMLIFKTPSTCHYMFYMTYSYWERLFGNSLEMIFEKGKPQPAVMADPPKVKVDIVRWGPVRHMARCSKPKKVYWQSYGSSMAVSKGKFSEGQERIAKPPETVNI